MDERHTRLADLETWLIDGSPVAKLRVVFLHGYDMRPADLTPFAHSLAIPGVAYAFPQAPNPVSATGYAWWPGSPPRSAGQPSIPRDLWQDYPAGRERARTLIRNLLESLRSQCDVPVILAGFSQGGMLACDSLLMEDTRIGALAMLSASCIASAEWQENRERLDGTPTFVSHGRRDPDLSFDAGLRLASFLACGGAKVTWAPFDGGHEIPFFVWRQFKRFVQAILREAAQDITHAYETH
jgi:phospholipase/carboxylesterase